MRRVRSPSHLVTALVSKAHSAWAELVRQGSDSKFTNYATRRGIVQRKCSTLNWNFVSHYGGIWRVSRREGQVYLARDLDTLDFAPTENHEIIVRRRPLRRSRTGGSGHSLRTKRGIMVLTRLRTRALTPRGITVARAMFSRITALLKSSQREHSEPPSEAESSCWR